MNNGMLIANAMRFTHRDRLCIPVPFYHCFGMVLANLACVVTGATMVIPAAYFDAEATLRAVVEERCTALHGVPTMFIAELEHPAFASCDLSTLRTGIMAGSPCPIEIMKRVVNQMHCRELTIAYGLTEASPVITQTTTDDPINLRVTTVGKALPHTEVKIVDPQTGATLPLGEQGELYTRGYHVMKGYYNDVDATRGVIDADGWLHTGDLSVLDENGYCKITGRAKDVILRGGENISPREIEEFLFTCPGISDVEVIGVPDRKYGEQVAAWIVREKGSELTAEQVRQFCEGKIARFKIPHYVKFVEEFPITISGKVQKFRMREIAVKELGLESEAGIETASWPIPTRSVTGVRQRKTRFEYPMNSSPRRRFAVADGCAEDAKLLKRSYGVAAQSSLVHLGHGCVPDFPAAPPAIELGETALSSSAAGAGVCSAAVVSGYFRQ